MENWYLYILAGLAAGVMSSLFGVGGGILIVPILTIAFAFGQKSAQGMSLFIMLPIALAGALRYKLNPDIPINLPVCFMMALGGIAGAMIGTQLVFSIPQILLRRMFAVFVIITGIHMFVKSYAKPAAKEPPQKQVENSFTEGNKG
jgi:uncharacterized protein